MTTIKPNFSICERCQHFKQIDGYIVCTMTPRSFETVFAVYNTERTKLRLYEDANIHKSCPFTLEHAVSL